MIGARYKKECFHIQFLCLLSKEKNHTKIAGGLIEREERGERNCTLKLIEGAQNTV